VLESFLTVVLILLAMVIDRTREWSRDHVQGAHALDNRIVGSGCMFDPEARVFRGISPIVRFVDVQYSFRSQRRPFPRGCLIASRQALSFGVRTRTALLRSPKKFVVIGVTDHRVLREAGQCVPRLRHPPPASCRPRAPIRLRNQFSTPGGDHAINRRGMNEA